MERLTEKHYLGTDHYMKCSGSCNVDMDCIDCPSFDRLVERLAAYEDTGLEPESVEALKLSMMGKAISEITEFDGLPIDRLRELAKADKAGRLVVLPCKVGDTVWITGSVRRLYSEKVRTFFCGNPSYGRGMADNSVQMIRTTGCDIPIREFGKTVFLTREEAEKVLEAMKK
nr:MAG TPA: hypothetical protein [Caudoviricetes sp.]